MNRRLGSILFGSVVAALLNNPVSAMAQATPAIVTPSICPSGTAAFLAESERERSELGAAVAASGQANDIRNVVERGALSSKPRLRNRRTIGRALEENYPPLLRDAGISGSVTLLVKIGEDGVVAFVSVFRGARDPAFNTAARAVIQAMRFDPAQHAGCPVPAWTLVPVTFSTNR